ncbi:MAG TPA: enoyl-CoA hydratase/isomerase family protein [Allosphingosinicella sp.]
MIRIDIEGPTAWLRLDRPQARNALTMDAFEEMARQLDVLAGLEARLLIVTGEGSHFCAGADLAEFAELQSSEAARRRFRIAIRAALDGFARLPIPVIAYVEGACFGAGVALAMAADMRLAAPDARFAITPAKIGIGYPQEDVHRLVSLVGPGQAARLLYTGMTIEAEEALRLGLIEAVGEPQELLALMDGLLACNPGSIAMLKRGVGLAAAGVRSEQGQDRAFEDLLHSPAAVELLSRARAGRRLPPTDS